VLQSFKKRVFVKRMARPQQFEQRILGNSVVADGILAGNQILAPASCAARGNVNVVGDKRPRRDFQLRSGPWLAGEAFDEIANAFALLLGAGRELYSHSMSRMHHTHHTFGVHLHVGHAQAQIYR